MKPVPTDHVAHAASTNVRLRVAFVLAPRFTLTAFAGFVDALRLAADEGDRSRQHLLRWAVLGSDPIKASCGTTVNPTAPLHNPTDWDCVVVVGGLLHGGQRVPEATLQFLKSAARLGKQMIGLCTGSFVLARAGLLEGHVACVSWFHRDDFTAEFPHLRVVSNRMFVVDRDRLTCAGGTSVVHLAAYLIERTIGRAQAMKALRIMIEEQPLPATTLQPEEVLTERSNDTVVHKAMLLLEQQLHQPLTIDDLSQTLGIGRRQLERRFRHDVGLSPASYRQRLRLERAQWLLGNSDLDMTAIALECGFTNSAHFSRTMRQALGESPSTLRVKVRRSDAKHQESVKIRQDARGVRHDHPPSCTSTSPPPSKPRSRTLTPNSGRPSPTKTGAKKITSSSSPARTTRRKR